MAGEQKRSCEDRATSDEAGCWCFAGCSPVRTKADPMARQRVPYSAGFGPWFFAGPSGGAINSQASSLTVDDKTCHFKSNRGNVWCPDYNLDEVGGPKRSDTKNPCSCQGGIRGCQPFYATSRPRLTPTCKVVGQGRTTSCSSWYQRAARSGSYCKKNAFWGGYQPQRRFMDRVDNTTHVDTSSGRAAISVNAAALATWPVLVFENSAA